MHVSELSQHRVAKASDVVQEGQTVTVWIKELDRDKNRISLSMIAPGTLTMRDLEEGMVVTGTVTRMERYGAFVDIGVGRDGMLHVKEMGHGFIEKPEDVIQLGEEVQVQIVGLDQRRGRVDLSRKSLLPPPAESASPAMARMIARTSETALIRPPKRSCSSRRLSWRCKKPTRAKNAAANERRRCGLGTNTRKRKTSSSARSPITARARASSLLSRQVS